MAHKVGQKGQVVIEKEIRDQLGIEPGWMTIQQVVDDYVVIRFVPGEHRRSLKGILAPYAKRTFPTEDELHDAIEEAWAEHVQEEAWQYGFEDQTEEKP